MTKSLKGGFKMDTNLKCPAWGRNSLVILVGIGIIIDFLPVFGASTRTEDNLAIVNFEEPSEELEGKLILLQENSLLPISDSISSGNQTKGKIRVVITAYSSSIWETDDSPFITAAGTWVRDGIVANNYLPMGTKIRIPELYGEKIFVVEDRMNRKQGNYHIDIWFPSYQAALNFGAKRTYIEILES